MADQRLRQIDFSRGQRWSNRSPGYKWPIKMCDGTGYPHGLAGDRIPLYARIMAAAGTFDAITSSRAFGAGRPHGSAGAEIARASGNRLDPSMVEVFAKLCAAELQWPERLDIRREPAFIDRRGAPGIDRGTDYAPA